MNFQTEALRRKAVRDFGIGPGAGAPVLIIQIKSENTREIVAILN